MQFTDKREFFFENRKVEKVEQVSVTWSDHQPGCARCRAVNFAKPATLSQTCAFGAPLALEELEKRNRPVRRAKEGAVREWARETGFKTYRGNRAAIKRATKYK